MTITRRGFSVALAAGVAMPAVLRNALGQSNTLKIGMILPVTGPGADSGKYSLTGAKIALDRVNKAGGVLSRQVELVTEDDQTTNPGAVLAFSKLAAQPDIVALRSLGGLDCAIAHLDRQRHRAHRHCIGGIGAGALSRRDQTVGELDGYGVRETEERRMLEDVRLLLDCVHDRGM